MEEKVNEPIQAATAQSPAASKGTSDNTRTVVTVLLLIFISPVGIILMWVWTKWPVWLKILITVPLILITLFFVGLFAVGLLAALNPNGALNEAKCVSQCEDSLDRNSCIQACSNTGKSGTYSIPSEK